MRLERNGKFAGFRKGVVRRIAIEIIDKVPDASEEFVWSLVMVGASRD